MLPKFDANNVWNHLLALKVGASRRVTVFTGVPTMYVKLIEEYERSLSKSERVVEFVKTSCSQKIRYDIFHIKLIEIKKIKIYSILTRVKVNDVRLCSTHPNSI